jgi:AAA+ superfamily predicted ATPase
MPDDRTSWAGGVPAWQILADTLLQREALLCRLGRGRLPRDFAGLYVDDGEVDQVLATLPGLDGPPQSQADALAARLRPALDAAGARFAASLGGPPSGPDAAFARLAVGCRLGDVDARVLALLAAVESSPHRMRLVAYIQDNVQSPRLTLDTVDRLVPGGTRCLAPGAPLRRAELVDVTADGPRATRMSWPASRVMWALAGDDSSDPELPPGARRLAASDVTTGTIAESEILLVAGADADSRLEAIRRAWPGRALLVTRLPATPVEWAAAVREAVVGERAVVLDLVGPLDPLSADRITKATELSWALSSPRELALDTLPSRPWSEIRLESGLAEATDWASALGVAPDPAYPLSRDQLRLVAAAAGADPARLATGVRRLAGGHLDDLAVHVRPQRTMADLVLPADQTAQLREMVARYRRRSTVYQEWGFPTLPSTGVVALFSGPSGTGKTLAAEVVAERLGLDMYKVDLSSVVSKYIGETEKNLERIFTSASAGDLVLFFDEADALFGKRSEVGDAHDRYANIEVAYLLQRLESYGGLVIMATNLQRNIDDAFLRRISVLIDFSPPDETHRRLIWQHAFPGGAPVHTLDFDYLARQFKVTGGVIRNAALGAAFLAAESGEKITMELVALALKREFQKVGRLLIETEFGRYFDLVNGEGDAAPAR